MNLVFSRQLIPEFNRYSIVCTHSIKIRKFLTFAFLVFHFSSLFCVSLLTVHRKFIVNSHSLHSPNRITRVISTLFSTNKVEPNVELYSHIKFSILGGGAFSLAMAKVLSYKNISCNLLVRNEAVAQHINEKHYHPKYLTDSLLPSQLWATSDPALALNGTNYIIHAVPMQQSREFLQSVKHLILPKVPILSVTKGVEQGTFSLMSDIMNEIIGPDNPTAFLSGPSFAKEIMDGEATAVVIASADDTLAKELAVILSSVEFRCHTSRDVIGIELGGAIKNVIALAAGMCEGLDLGIFVNTFLLLYFPCWQ